MTVDFGPIAGDYVEHRRAFPTELLRRLLAFGVGTPGQPLLDVGAGTGLLAIPLAAAGAKVLAVDVSHALLSHASGAISGAASLRRVVGRAECLPFTDDTFDAVTAAQCWHWFDRHIAPRELQRVLKPGGVLAVVYQMPVPVPGNVVEATEQLILHFNPRWRHANSAGINGQVLRDMQTTGYEQIESFSFDLAENYTPRQWRGVTRTTSAVGASMTPATAAAFDQAHEQMLHAWPARLVIPHRFFTAVARKPPARV